MKLLLSLIIGALPFVSLGQGTASEPAKSAGQLIDTIIKETGAALVPNTVDVIKEGDADTPVTGIASCMFATMDVLREAVEKNCNLIIVHEPLYYNHFDTTEQFKTDSVFLEKKKFINDHKLVVWRFHDYIHRIQPDGILAGMVEKLGWNAHRAEDNPYLFHFQNSTLGDLLKTMKTKFPTSRFQVVGEPEMPVSNVLYMPGAAGSEIQIAQLGNSAIDLVIGGEVPQWETYEYARDAVQQGRKKAVVFIGHVNSEEYGMKFCADWLQGFISEIPIHFIECGSSYWTY